jgi:hypothetical protein
MAMVAMISPQPLAFIVSDFLCLELVGPQQGRDHVDGDEDDGRRVDELDDHGQILLSAAA